MSWFSNGDYERPTGSQWGRANNPRPRTQPTTAVGTAIGPTVSRRSWDTGASSSSGLGSVLNNLTGNLSASSQLGQQGSADTAATLRSQGFGGLKKTKDFTSKAADFAKTAGNAIALTTNPGQALRNNWQSALQTGPNPATATGRTFADLNNSLNTVQALSNKGKNVPFGADIGSLAFQATPWGKLATLATGAGGDNVPDTLESFARPVTNLVGKAGKTGKKLEDWLNKGARSIGTPVQEVFNLGQRIPGVKEVGRQIHGVTTQLGTENPYGPYARMPSQSGPLKSQGKGRTWDRETRRWVEGTGPTLAERQGTGKPNYDAIMAEAVRANRGSQYEKDWQDWQRELDPGVDLSNRTFAAQQALTEANNRGQTNQPSDAFRKKLLVPTEEQERRYGRGYAIPNLAGATNKWASADVSNRKARDYSNLAGSTLFDVANQTVGFTNQAKTLTKEAEDFKASLAAKGSYTQDDINHFNGLRQQIANANASAADGYNGMAEAGLIQKDAQGRMSWTDSARSKASQDARIGFGHDVANLAADPNTVAQIGTNVRDIGNVLGNNDMSKYGGYAQLGGNVHNILTSPNPVGRTLEGVDRVGEAINPASITGKIFRGIASPFGDAAVDRVGRITGPAERGVDAILNNTFGLPSKLHKYFTKPDPIPQRDWRTGEVVPQVGSKSQGRGRTWDRETRRWVEGAGPTLAERQGVMAPQGYASSAPEPETFTVPQQPTVGQRVSDSIGNFGTSAGNMLALPFKAAANLVEHPVRTTRNVVTGLGHNVDNLAQSLSYVPQGVRQTFNPSPDESRLQGLVNTVAPIATGVKAANPQFWYEKALRNAALDPFNRDMDTNPQDVPSPMPLLANPHSSVPLKKSGNKYNTFAPPVVGRNQPRSPAAQDEKLKKNLEDRLAYENRFNPNYVPGRARTPGGR